MKKRSILINRKFQLTLAMTFAGISALTMAVIIVICANLLINNNSRLKNINENRQQLSEIQNELYSQNNEEIKNIINRNNGVITILIVSYIMQVLLIFYLMLKRSSRISGPIYLMNKYFDEIIEGNYPEIRQLRENDDFQELFAKFRKVTDILYKKDKG